MMKELMVNSMKDSSKKIIDELINRYPLFYNLRSDLLNAIDMLINSFSNGNKLLICGNGGSASDSEHIVGELVKGFVKKRPISKELKEKIDDKEISDYLQDGLPSIALTVENALSTAFSNDQNPSLVFAQQVNVLGKENDVLLAISTSGNSKNCVYASKVAKAKGLKVIALTGQKDSKLSDLADITIKAPETETYKIQECHLPIYHAICLALENEFFEE